MFVPDTEMDTGKFVPLLATLRLPFTLPTDVGLNDTLNTED